MAVVLSFVWGAILASRLRLSFLHMTLLFLSIQMVGVAANDTATGGFRATVLMGSALLAFTLGIVLHHFLSGSRHTRVAVYLAAHPTYDLMTLWVFATMVMGFVVYHYAVGGIPLMSPLIEQVRFDLTRSGMFGIPGRVTMFGTIFLVFLVASYRQLMWNDHERVQTLRLLVFVAVGIALLLTGMKSALIVLVEAILIAATYAPIWKPEERVPLRRIVAYTALALLVVVVVAAVYAERRGVSTNAVVAVGRRIFYTSGRAFHYVVSEFVPSNGLSMGHWLWWDIRHALGLVHLGPTLPYTSTQLISAGIHGRSLAEFVVPTTINLFGYLYLECGVGGMVLLAAGAGVLCSWLYGLVFQTNTIMSRSVGFYVQLAMFSAITKGSVVYDVVNRAFSLAVAVTLLILAVGLVKGRLGRGRLL